MPTAPPANIVNNFEYVKGCGGGGGVLGWWFLYVEIQAEYKFEHVQT